MKKSNIFIFSIVLITNCSSPDLEKESNLSEQVIIPDENFKTYLLKNKEINTNGDEEIQFIEARSFNGKIDCRDYNISDLTGIEAFPLISELDCHSNELTEIDLSKNISLKRLDCGYNSLTNLDISKNNALKFLSCDNNLLTELNLNEIKDLIFLDCQNNRISYLLISQNTKLNRLFCGGNYLSNLDVSKNLFLKHLTCDNNRLTQLDVSKNSALTELICSYNYLSNIDLSRNSAIRVFSGDGNKFDCDELGERFGIK
jgi:hypothetical protein